MVRTQTMVQLNQDLLQRLDRRAARQGVSRSQLIREAVETFLADDHASELDRRIAEGYRRRPQGGEYDVDEWGDLDRQMTGFMADQMRQLAREEREAGHEPW